MASASPSPAAPPHEQSPHQPEQPPYEAVMSVVRPARRRPRSVRLTVAVVLLATPSVLVAVALATRSSVLLVPASLVGLAAGWVATRLVWAELLTTRREGARDRARQAQAYRRMYAERASEQAAFTTAVGDRLAQRAREVADLEAALADAREQVRALADRAPGSRVEDPVAGPVNDVLADLVAWERRVGEAAAVVRRRRA